MRIRVIFHVENKRFADESFSLFMENVFGNGDSYFFDGLRRWRRRRGVSTGSADVTVDLGYVDTTSGQTVAENNPLETAGVASGGTDATVPADIESSVFVVVDQAVNTKYLERMGAGIRDMVDRCRAAGLSDPEFKLTDGFVVSIRRKPEAAFETMRKASGQLAPLAVEAQFGTGSGLSRDQVEILSKCSDRPRPQNVRPRGGFRKALPKLRRAFVVLNFSSA